VVTTAPVPAYVMAPFCASCAYRRGLFSAARIERTLSLRTRYIDDHIAQRSLVTHRHVHPCTHHRIHPAQSSGTPAARIARAMACLKTAGQGLMARNTAIGEFLLMCLAGQCKPLVQQGL
jgi:hypothetical protein